jgi:hypothetical protein
VFGVIKVHEILVVLSTGTVVLDQRKSICNNRKSSKFARGNSELWPVFQKNSLGFFLLACVAGENYAMYQRSLHYNEDCCFQQGGAALHYENTVTDPLNAFLYLEVVKNIEKMYSSHPVI